MKKGKYPTKIKKDPIIDEKKIPRQTLKTARQLLEFTENLDEKPIKSKEFASISKQLKEEENGDVDEISEDEDDGDEDSETELKDENDLEMNDVDVESEDDVDELEGEEVENEEKISNKIEVKKTKKNKNKVKKVLKSSTVESIGEKTKKKKKLKKKKNNKNKAKNDVDECTKEKSEVPSPKKAKSHQEDEIVVSPLNKNKSPKKSDKEIILPNGDVTNTEEKSSPNPSSPKKKNSNKKNEISNGVDKSPSSPPLSSSPNKKLKNVEDKNENVEKPEGNNKKCSPQRKSNGIKRKILGDWMVQKIDENSSEFDKLKPQKVIKLEVKLNSPSNPEENVNSEKEENVLDNESRECEIEIQPKRVFTPSFWQKDTAKVFNKKNSKKANIFKVN